MTGTGVPSAWPSLIRLAMAKVRETVRLSMIDGDGRLAEQMVAARESRGYSHS